MQQNVSLQTTPCCYNHGVRQHRKVESILSLNRKALHHCHTCSGGYNGARLPMKIAKAYSVHIYAGSTQENGMKSVRRLAKVNYKATTPGECFSEYLTLMMRPQLPGAHYHKPNTDQIKRWVGRVA